MCWPGNPHYCVTLAACIVQRACRGRVVSAAFGRSSMLSSGRRERCVQTARQPSPNWRPDRRASVDPDTFSRKSCAFRLHLKLDILCSHLVCSSSFILSVIELLYLSLASLNHAPLLLHCWTFGTLTKCLTSQTVKPPASTISA